MGKQSKRLYGAYIERERRFEITVRKGEQIMTNKERILTMPTKEAVRKLTELFHSSLFQYIDYEKYMDSTDDDIRSAIRAVGTADVMPSQAEIQSYTITHRDEIGFEENLQKYIQEKTRSCLLLEETSMFTYPYWTIYESGDSYSKVPAENIINIKLY